MNYHEYEKQVFDWMMAKNKKDPSFTFSVRQTASKGARTDYFIGTEKSNYFSFTLWSIPVGFPGSASDLIDFVFGKRDGGFTLRIEFNQTKTPHDDQNKWALELIRNIKPKLKTIYNSLVESHGESKTEFYYLLDKKVVYKTIDDLYESLDKNLSKVVPIVDEEILKLKKKNSSFNAERITQDAFETLIKKMEKRFKKYKQEIIVEPKPKEEHKDSPGLNYSKNPNIILYGPPGTGKTYNTIEMAYEIIHGQKTETHRIAQEYFQSNKGTQIEFITFHQNMAYEDFVQGIKPDINSDDIKFVKRDGLFKTICDRAKKNYLSSRKKVVQEDVSFEEVFNEFIDKLQEEEVSQIEVKMKKASYFITEVNDRSILFSNSKGVQKSLNISTLKGMFYERENKTIIGGMQNYYNPLLDELLKIELEKKGLSNGEVISLKNYVLIIDEINRANISRVFGELITLLEKDKRLGQENEISVTLPSGDELVVPPNLYIIGTMNTADKSIALLDIALRRRFDFKKMFPKTELVLSEYKDAFDRINKKIKELKGADFQIGHSYFMGADFSLDYNMESKVLPLLYEYFMNDEDAIKEVLSTAGFEFKDSKESDSGLIEFVDIKKVEPKDA